MEGVREFLESSTIHGLTYISATRNKLTRLLWIAIVFCGFFVAGFLIIKSFLDWDKNPIDSSIQTFPISEVHFPTITVCPPKVQHDLFPYNIFFRVPHSFKILKS